ncbi:MAG: flagellar hook capping FlgD N-terminal domain-containing protein [Bryobacteraceae bacterium]
MSPSITANTNTSTASTAAQNPTSTVTSSSATVDQNMFLQLLVAQLQNQDPLDPTDSSQFVTQLAQFQQLSQSVDTGQDVSSILTDMNQIVANISGTATPSSSQN